MLIWLVLDIPATVQIIIKIPKLTKNEKMKFGHFTQIENSEIYSSIYIIFSMFLWKFASNDIK
jgi:hypothetical protein